MRTRLWVLLALAGVGLACSGRDAREDTIERLAELERRLEEGRQLESQLPQLELELQAVDGHVEDLGAILVADEADALLRLRPALERSGFRVVDLRPLGAFTVDEVAVLRFEVEAVTGFDLAEAAFRELERTPLIVIVEDLTLRRDGDLARLAFTARLGLAPPSP